MCIFVKKFNLTRTADIRFVQEQLGHKSIRSTQIYTRLVPKDLKKIHQQCHPREKQYKTASEPNKTYTSTDC